MSHIRNDLNISYALVDEKIINLSTEMTFKLYVIGKLTDHSILRMVLDFGHYSSENDQSVAKNCYLAHLELANALFKGHISYQEYKEARRDCEKPFYPLSDLPI